MIYLMVPIGLYYCLGLDTVLFHVCRVRLNEWSRDFSGPKLFTSKWVNCGSGPVQFYILNHCVRNQRISIIYHLKIKIQRKLMLYLWYNIHRKICTPMRCYISILNSKMLYVMVKYRYKYCNCRLNLQVPKKS